jgi:hypothetical protein
VPFRQGWEKLNHARSANTFSILDGNTALYNLKNLNAMVRNALILTAPQHYLYSDLPVDEEMGRWGQ